MINLFIYISAILLMFIICMQGGKATFKAPRKIKIISIIIYFLMILKFISLTLLVFVNNIRNLYWLKWIYFLDFLAIPICILICFYICIKNNKFNLNYIIFIIVLITSTLIFFMTKYSLKINMFNSQYYIMELLTPINMYVFFIFVNLIFLILCLIKHNNKYINKNILYLMFFSTIVNISDIILSFLNINILPPNILGNIIWIYTLYTAVNKLIR
ncbi:membrane protein [Clostridium botulinum A2 117]|uniref:Histidine kinase n=1 Tax=Clostridium botulinum TaxID=1491 RepID=A0AA43Y9P4_CLOBO|nr:hypothetical protein [Clostridium botulinum]KEI83174.1 membrane protein [Clostridium botulinum A2 117]KEJ03924.1 membrane protein [Clostridium botulinum F 357]MBN3417138.1 hypothetical protein [Clostridium botulinum]MBN3443550.1 hypothetical protein [Clostridium botulinum]NFI08907.1 hypothetical protein [Clostridium botulinum]